MDTIHHTLLYSSPVHPANLFDITNWQNGRLFSGGIGIFFKPQGKCVQRKTQSCLVFEVSVQFFSSVGVFLFGDGCNTTDK